jgi:hypothetical protein
MWAQLVSACLGVWLMAAPTVLEYGAPAATVDRVLGPLIVSFALIAMWEVTRNLRFLNLACAASLLVAPTLLGYAGPARLNEPIVGILVAALTCLRWRRSRAYDGGWLGLLRGPPTL